MIENFHNQLHYNLKHDLLLKIVIISSAKGCQQCQTGTGFILCSSIRVLLSFRSLKSENFISFSWRSEPLICNQTAQFFFLPLICSCSSPQKQANAPPPHLPAPLSRGAPAARAATAALQPYSIRFEVSPHRHQPTGHPILSVTGGDLATLLHPRSCLHHRAFLTPCSSPCKAVGPNSLARNLES